MRTLRRGMLGEDVALWQTFLEGKGYAAGDSQIFDDATVDATEQYQADRNMTADGIVGAKTYSVALTEGLPADTYEDPSGWPTVPTFPALTGQARGQLFGTFAYVPAPIPGSPENIRITDHWGIANIVMVEIPQLVGVPGAPATGKIPFHMKAAPQLRALWQAWEDAGLLPLVLSFAGSWAPRFVRGSQTYLSNHSWGTAFDINAPENPLGSLPKPSGTRGSTRELVALATAHGFYWGGFFARRDGMHFEVAQIVDP